MKEFHNETNCILDSNAAIGMNTMCYNYCKKVKQQLSNIWVILQLFHTHMFTVTLCTLHTKQLQKMQTVAIIDFNMFLYFSLDFRMRFYIL